MPFRPWISLSEASEVLSVGSNPRWRGLARRVEVKDAGGRVDVTHQNAARAANRSKPQAIHAARKAGQSISQVSSRAVMPSRACSEGRQVQRAA